MARFDKEVLGGPPPHSTDAILAKYRFCNINREHDAVTRWVKKHVRDFDFYSKKRMIVALAVSRIFNEPETLKHLMPLTDLSEARKTLYKLRASGQKLMRGAYMTGAHGPKNKGVNVIDYYCKIFEKIQEQDFDFAPTLQAVADRLMSIDGLGAFFINQICADLRYTQFYHMAPDWGTFIMCGYGTCRGLNRWKGHKKPKANGDQATYISQLFAVREYLREHFDHEAVNYFDDPNNLANAFCEWDKYERVLWSTRTDPVKLKRRYP